MFVNLNFYVRKKLFRVLRIKCSLTIFLSV